MNRFEIILQQKTSVTKPRVLFVLYNNMGSITNRIRGLIFAEPFREMKWTAEFIDVEDATEEQLVQLAANFDIVYLLKIPFLSLIRKLRRGTSAKLVFDLTDALWMPHHRWNQWHDLEAILSSVDAIFSDNEFVAAYGRKYNSNVHIIPACTQVERFDEARLNLPSRDDDNIVIGWVGTVSTINALHVIKEPLERVFSRHPNLHLRLLILGFTDMRVLPDFKHVRFSVLPKYDEEEMIREVLQMDIGVFPPPCGLEDYAIRGPLKGLLYMTGGKPAVCENGGGCAAIIQDGINGMLASSPAEWEQKLELLISSREIRSQIGQNALATVRKTNSLKAITERLAKAILKVLYEPSRMKESGTSLDTPDAHLASTRAQAGFLPTGNVPKRIMIACSHFWPSIGGVENRIEQFSAALAAAGYDVTVVTPVFPGRTSDVRNGVRIKSIDPSKMIDGNSAWPSAVRHSLLSGEYDTCILIQDPLGDIIWSVEGAAPPPSTRLIIQPIINADGYSKWRDHEQFGPRLAGILKGADSTVAMTKTGPENQFMRLFGINPVYIPNASSVPEPAGDFRARHNIPADRFLILHVANLYWVKNHIGLLESLHDMPESWLLVMVGNPSGEPECAQKFSEALARRPDVLYIPGLSREWVSAAMKAADVLVLSSFGEGSPNTILEAMAHGKPWMATPQCGAANDHAGGIICDLADFYRYLAILHNNPELRHILGDMGKLHWQSCLSWPKVAAGWIDLIENGLLHETFEMPPEIRDIMARINNVISGLLKQTPTLVLPESRHAHHWLDGLRGLEIGPSAQNPFGLDARYVGMRDEIYEEEQLRLAGSAVSLDIEALADNIPLPDESEDFILSSHVIEHCPDVITTLLEWFRIVRNGGLIYMIVPLRNAARSDVGRDITSWKHILDDFTNQANEHSEPEAGRFGHCHYHVFDIDSMRTIVENVFGDRLQLVDCLDVDDKIGNGFTLVYRKVIACNDALPWDFWHCFATRRTAMRVIRQEKDAFVNICMITYNRLEFTRQAIAALVAHTDYPYVLTVIDNNSRDGSKEYLLDLNRQGIIKNLVLLDENIGVAKASNIAWSLEPDAGYYLKLDNDVVIQKPGWLAAMVRIVDEIPEMGAVAYNFEPVSYPPQKMNGLTVRVKAGSIGGACFLVPKRTHDKIGFWCEDYGLYSEEDFDYCFRMELSKISYTYMEDENIGFHLPAGKAAIIDLDSFASHDGIEEIEHQKYRELKDDNRRKVIQSGLRDRNCHDYRYGRRSLYIFSEFFQSWDAAGRPGLVAIANPPQSAQKLKVAVYSLDAKNQACGHYRIQAPLHALASEVELFWVIEFKEKDFHVCPGMAGIAEEADLIVVQRFFPRAETVGYLDYLSSLGKPMIFEIDDLLTQLPPTNPSYGWGIQCAPYMYEFIRRCAAVTVSTEELKNHFSTFNDAIHILPNMLDSNLWHKTVPPSSGPVVIGYAGTITHNTDLTLLEEVLDRIASSHGNGVAFTFMGCATERISRLPGFSYIQFETSFEAYARKLQEIPIDIMLVPLEENAFNRCKSNIKWLEYSSCGIAGIYSDLTPYSSCVDHGVTGLLVGNDPQQWFNAIDLLIGNPQLRRSIAANARRKVLAEYTLKTGARRWLEAYREIIGKKVEPSLTKESTPAGDTMSVVVSIIMPLFNNMAYTRQCLEQLRQNTAGELYELILVDNGCTDDTYTLFGGLPATVKVIRNIKNQGFAKACNQGAREARGKYLLFLNNDTEPQPGWLEPLIEVVEQDSSVAAVGAKLLYPDGTIQHAGVAIVDNRRDNDPLCGEHVWRGRPAGQPEANQPYCYQALTAACLLVRREVFESVECFDEGYWNGYEDVDLCFKLGQKGWKLVYQPASVVVHHESKSGAERFAGVSRNIQRLHEKWQGKIQPDLRIHADGRVEEGVGIAAGLMAPYVPRATPIAPLVSMIIPLFNQAHLTKACVEAIQSTVDTPELYELILVDNGSHDWTPEYLRSLGMAVVVITNRENLGFARACNQGARIARGEHLLFLNNDTVPQPGWLDALLAGMRDERADIVGAKLLYPNGRVQHAGVAFNSNSIGYHIFKNFAADAPAVNKKRFMQCVTAACMLVTRQLFNELGGFDEQFRNGFEDVDFCLRAGQSGKRILYNPDAVLIHHEEQSEGRKQHDRENMQRYLTRWRGRVHCDDEALYDVEGFGVEWHADGTSVVRPRSVHAVIQENNRYPLIPLVGHSSSSILQKLSSSPRLKGILERYTTDD